MTTVELSRPIQAHGETRRTIELREPNAADIVACGFPFTFNNGVQSINTPAISAFVSRLADIPPSSVASMGVLDWSECMGAILGFFGPSAPPPTEASSTDSLISVSSGNGSLAPS